MESGLTDAAEDSPDEWVWISLGLLHGVKAPCMPNLQHGQDANIFRPVVVYRDGIDTIRTGSDSIAAQCTSCWMVMSSGFFFLHFPIYLDLGRPLTEMGRCV